jgi:hypothetical protein
LCSITSSFYQLIHFPIHYSVPVRSVLRTASSPTPSTWHCSPAERYCPIIYSIVMFTQFPMPMFCLKTGQLYFQIAYRDLMTDIHKVHLTSIQYHDRSLLTTYLSLSLQARAIIKAEPPFAIMHINEPWTALSGLSQAEAEGRPLSDSLRLHSSQARHWSFILSRGLL